MVDLLAEFERELEEAGERGGHGGTASGFLMVGLLVSVVLIRRR